MIVYALILWCSVIIIIIIIICIKYFIPGFYCLFYVLGPCVA
jgi:hypothetical protein